MSVSCECCVLSGGGLCHRLITRPEEPYRVCCVSECDREASIMRRPWPTGGLLRHLEKKIVIRSYLSLQIASITQSLPGIISVIVSRHCYGRHLFPWFYVLSLADGSHSLATPLFLAKFKLIQDRNQSSERIAEPVRVGVLKRILPESST
jgi:hypothetical protein